MNKTKRAAIYGRVSTDEQAKFGFSIDNQLDRLREYAEENNLMIVEEYVDEGYSAGTTKRPALQKLLNDLNNFELIIFTKLDRFTRNVLDANEMVLLFDKKGVSIKAIDEDDVDTSTADGMFMFNLKVSLAQRELKKGSERITTVFEYKVKQGQAINGHQPLGYKSLKVGDYSIVVKDEETSHIIEDMFNHFLTYHSVRKTCIYINEKYNFDYVYLTYDRYLRKKQYKGEFRGNTKYCEPYITPEVYDRIQELLNNNIKVRKNNNTYLFTGIIKCPNCGSKLTGVCNINKYGTKYHYYMCNKHRQLKACDFKRIREDKIEDFMIKNINKFASEYIATASVEVDNQPKPEIDIKEILEEMDNLNYMFKKKRISQKEYDYDYEELEKKLAEAEKQMPKKADLSGLKDFLNSGWENVYHTLEREDKRALFRNILKEVVIDRNKNILPPIFL